MGEIGQIIDYLQQAAGDNANIIWGNGTDPNLGNKISVTIIATGFAHQVTPVRTTQMPAGKPLVEKEQLPVRDDFNVVKEPEVPSQEVEFPGVSVADDLSFSMEEPVAENPVKPELPKQTKVQENQTRTTVRPERESISKWFNHQFGGLFTDDDEEVK